MAWTSDALQPSVHECSSATSRRAGAAEFQVGADNTRKVRGWQILIRRPDEGSHRRLLPEPSAVAGGRRAEAAWKALPGAEERSAALAPVVPGPRAWRSGPADRLVAPAVLGSIDE